MTVDSPGNKITLAGLRSLTDMEIGAMSIDATRRALKELVPLGLIQLRNDQIDALTAVEASRKLNEARRTAQTMVRS